MKTRTIAFLLIVHSFSPYCVPGSSVHAKHDDVTSDEYAVYSAVIQAMFVTSRVKTIVITKRTTFYDYKSVWEKPEDYTRSMLEQLRPMSQETLDALEKQTNEERLLESRFNLTIKYVLLDKQASPDTSEAFAEQWTSFSKTYPDSPGIVSLSRVGFNADRNQAIVYVAITCAGLCGKGYYVLLTKSRDDWKIEKDIMVWVS